MDLLKMVGLSLAAAMLCVVLRQTRPEMAMLCGLAAGALVLMAVLLRLSGVLDALARLAAKAGLAGDALGTVVQVLGVSYLAEFGAQACRDAGEGALAAKVELGGRVAILALSVPLLIAVMETITALLK